MHRMNYIKEFITLAETLSFSKTAELTFVTQPVLSRHIAKLEQQLGCRLLVRNTRNVELTEEGKVCYESFCRMEQEYRHMLGRLALSRRGEEGVLKIAIAEYYFEEFAEPCIEYYQSKYPRVSVILESILPSDGLTKLDSEQVDITVNPSFPPTDGSYEKIPFAKDRMSIICRRDHPLASKEKLTFSDINNEELILFGGDNKFVNSCNTWILNTLKQHSAVPAALSFCTNINSLFYKIRTTNAVGIGPMSLRHSDRSYVAVKEFAEDEADMDVCLFYKSDSTNPLIHGFINSILEMKKEKPEI